MTPHFKIGDIVLVDYYQEEWEVINIKTNGIDEPPKYDIKLITTVDISDFLEIGEVFEDVVEHSLVLSSVGRK